MLFSFCWPLQIRLAWHLIDLPDLLFCFCFCECAWRCWMWKKQHGGGGVHIFTVYILCSYCSALTFSPLQQVQTCVWDVSSPFRIVLVNGSKVNAEETAKVNTCSFCKTSIQVPVNMSRKTCTRGFTLAFLSGWITQRSLKATVKYTFLMSSKDQA